MGTITKNAKITDYKSQNGVDYSTGNTLNALLTDDKGALIKDTIPLTEGGISVVNKDTLQVNADNTGQGTGSNANVKAGGAGSDADPQRAAGGSTTVTPTSTAAASTASTNTSTTKNP